VRERLESAAGSPGADLLLDLLEAAKVDQRVAAGRLTTLPGGDASRHDLVNVGLELFVEIAIEAVAMGPCPPAGPDPGTQRHHSLLGLEHLGDSQNDPRPLIEFTVELEPAGCGQRICLDPLPFRRRGPCAFDEAFVFETMECRKKRAGFHLERPRRDLLDSVRDPEAVPRLELERAQYQQVKGAFQKLRL
jgi:hypothetical protein